MDTYPTSTLWLKLDITNAFNTLLRKKIIEFIDTKFHLGGSVTQIKAMFQNYLKRSYSTDSDIDFGGPDLTVPMQTGTQQGCKTSSYLFDCVVFHFPVTYLKSNLHEDPERICTVKHFW